MTKIRTTRITIKAPTDSSSSDLAPLITDLRGLIQSARHAVAAISNSSNWRTHSVNRAFQYWC